ncbi:mucoidy inhibitor MuiA family protein [Siphonobacter curvatus]|uniref:Mucoidy inhibitor MuiA family protein n=1 Tax=Siphonobacter curvatus TaxID=2094562 RepID=A0A2S7IJH1_9BACT|nr:mucoidy inhibitor MuiA family protein [Siphonobacter curvatus]PQA56337.1 hypothetical protein C5O19_18525 [Siphonobacter curvatus]
MKRTLLFLLLSSFVALAEPTPIPLTSKLEKVTVFLNGAQIQRTAQTALPAGRTELYFKNLSPKLDKQSIQLRGEGNFTVLSVQAQQSYADEGVSRLEKTKQFDKRRAEIEANIQLEQKLLQVYKQEETLLLKNQELGGKVQTLKASEIKEAADFQRTRLTEVLTKQLELERKINQYTDELKVLNGEQTRVNTDTDQQVGEVWITISSPQPIAQAQFTLTYFVADAGWIPSYDARVNDLTKPLQLGYKAQVFQYTGEDWKQIQLSLSNADPRQRATQSMLKPWVTGQTNYYPELNPPISQTYNPTVTQVSGKVTDVAGVAIANASVMVSGTSLGTLTDENGFYRLSIPPKLPQSATQLVFAGIGFRSQRKPFFSEILDVQLEADQQALNEVVVRGQGIEYKRALTGAVQSLQGKVAGVPLELNEKEAPTSFTYDIKTPYTIPSDGKVYAVEVKQVELPALYEYSAVPKLNSDVFLTAQIPNWERYGLLNGDIQLFLEGNYVGKSTLNLDNTGDTLRLSLGRDKAVQVQRTKKKEFTKKSFLGSTQSEERRYEISVRNTRRQPISLVVYDQFPISKMKEIEILDHQASGAEVNAETGIFHWRWNLKPGEAQSAPFSYTIRSPKATASLLE